MACVVLRSVLHDPRAMWCGILIGIFVLVIGGTPGSVSSYSTYDTLNRLSTKAAPSEATVTNTYDLAGHLVSASDNSAAIQTATTSGTLSTITATYDALNHLISKIWSPVQAQAPPAASSTTSFAYTYSQNNQRVGQTTTDNSWWSYPAATAASLSYTPNNLDQYTAIGTVTPTYDGNGNLTFDGTTTYGYDAESRLTTASQGGTTIATYAYDALGHRKSQNLSGTTTILVNDPENNPLLDYAGSGGAVQRWYVCGQNPNGLLNQVNAAAGIPSRFSAQGRDGNTPTATCALAFGNSSVAATASGGCLTSVMFDATTPKFNGALFLLAEIELKGWEDNVCATWNCI